MTISLDRLETIRNFAMTHMVYRDGEMLGVKMSDLEKCMTLEEFAGLYELIYGTTHAIDEVTDEPIIYIWDIEQYLKNNSKK